MWEESEKKYITYEYDEWGKVSKITYHDEGYVEYDWAGQLFGGFVEKITDHRNDADRPGDIDSTFTYDYYWPLNKIRSYTDCNNYTVNYDYSFAYGEKTHLDINDISGTRLYDVNYVYDRAGRLVDVCEPLMGVGQNLIAGFEYYDNGNRKKLHYYLDASSTEQKGVRPLFLPCRLTNKKRPVLTGLYK